MIRADEAYSKYELMQRFGISQRFWDKMLDEGLPYTNIGHARWVTGKDMIDYMTTHAKHRDGDNVELE